MSRKLRWHDGPTATWKEFRGCYYGFFVGIVIVIIFALIFL